MIEDIFSDSADHSDSQEVSEEITWKRQVRERWTNHKDTVLAEQEPTDFSDDTYIICISQIWADHGILPQEMALFPSPSPFIHMLQSATARVMERRNLSFDRKYIYAIADPDHEGENESMLLAHGFMIAGPLGYEMDLPIHLSRDKDENDFDLFFALRWAKLDFTDNSRFFDFHLRHTFQNDLDTFSTYIRQQFWQYRTLKSDLPSSDDYAQKSFLLPAHEQSFSQWLDIKKSNGLSIEKKNADVLPINDQERLVVISQQAQEVIFSILHTYFSQTDHASLRHVLNGYTAPMPLFFKYRSKEFIEVFRESYYQNHISSPKKAVRDWIVKNFSYLNYKTAQAKQFDPDNVARVLFSSSKGKNIRIDTSPLEHLNNNQ